MGIASDVLTYLGDSYALNLFFKCYESPHSSAALYTYAINHLGNDLLS